MLKVTATPNLVDGQGLMGLCRDKDAKNWAIGLGEIICFPKFQMIIDSSGKITREIFHSLDPQRCTWFKVDPKLVKTLESLEDTQKALQEGEVMDGCIFPEYLVDRESALTRTINAVLRNNFAQIVQ